jgi:hypothetical protein
MEDVLAAKRVMDQSIFNDPSALGDGSHAMSSMTASTARGASFRAIRKPSKTM